MFFRRIYCHFCGSRSTFSKSSGIPEFRCTTCDAVNYLDSKGDILDTPAGALIQPPNSARKQSPPFQTFTHKLPETLDHQRGQAFCNTCVNNQRMYMEALGNYLPDDEDPTYYEYERALPQFKVELEKRYPQVCKRCAPIAQGKINRSDYYAGTQNINVMAQETARRGRRSARGRRDDWWKWSMRLFLGILGWVINASLLLQVAWHVYGVLAARDMGAKVQFEEDVGIDFDPMPHNCVQETLHMRFSQACYGELGAHIPRALLTSLCLIWYNSGLKDWYHHTHRIEQITGQTEHFRLQTLLLAARAIAWYTLAAPTFTESLTTQQLMASHGFVAAFMLAIHWLSNRNIKSIRFRLRQKMMPRPDERDVLGAYAGPESEEYPRQASSIPPSQLLARERLDRITPFPISNLAPGQPRRGQVSASSSMPSPPPSDETDDEGGDPMEIDEQPSSFRSQMPGAKIDRTYRPKVAKKRSDVRSLHNYSSTQPAGWSGMRDEIFGLQDSMQAQAERKRKEADQKAKLKFEPPVQPSPFRGRLPAAPMSMERRLRNPVTQLAFKETPASTQKNFMQQMRSGIEQGRSFTRTKEIQKQSAHFGLTVGDERDDDFSPVKTRTAGQLELKQSTWQLPADKAQATGLEDLFAGNSFSIADGPAIPLPTQQEDNRKMLKLALGIAVPVAVVAVSWNIPSVRRAACLWLVDRLEALGY